METRDDIYARLISITASYSGDTVQSSKDPHKYDAFISIEDNLNRLIDELYATKNEIVLAISKVKNQNYRRILMLRYVDGKTWEEIANKMGYGVRHITRLHGNALAEIQKIVSNLCQKPENH